MFWLAHNTFDLRICYLQTVVHAHQHRSPYRTVSYDSGKVLMMFIQHRYTDQYYRMFSDNHTSHTRGSAFIANGVIYYSPNSARHVSVPPHHDDYRFYKRNARIDNFRAPEWWTRPYGFLGFVPLLPSFNGVAFGCLHDILSTVEEKDYNGKRVYVMSSKYAATWRELETTLIRICSLLRNKFLVSPALTPPAPSFYGLEKTFGSIRAARLSIAACRDWFIIWMGLLSFLISEIKFRSLVHDIPDWFTFLVDQGVSQPWLNGFYQSTICNFSENCPRTGLFINWLAEDKPTFPLKLFQMANVPVWYPWTPELAKLVSHTPSLADLQPIAEKLQNATTFITCTPSTFFERYGITRLAALPPSPSKSPSNFSHKEASPSFDQSESNTNANFRDMTYAQLTLARNTVIKTKPWSSFFHGRKTRNLDRATVETPEAKQSRLNRERQPPEKKVNVYVWDWSDEDPLQLIRTRVTTQKESIDLLEIFPNSQSIYDSWANEWDLCEYFGDSDELDDNDNNDDNQVYHAHPSDLVDPDPQDNPQAHAAYIQACINDPKPFPTYTPHYQPDKQDWPPLDVSFDIVEYLSEYYGFVPPLEYSKSKEVDEEGWVNCMKSIGVMTGTKLLSLHNLHDPIICFINALQSPQGPSSQLFDVAPKNRVSINTPELFQKIRLVQGLFIVQPFAFKADRMPWSVALTNIPDALYVFRLLKKHDHSPISLSYRLLIDGVTFRTVQPLGSISSTYSLRDVTMLIPIRLYNYRFGPTDYEVYESQRAALLSSPRGRAALLCGGIVARLAKEHLSLDSACFGPSSFVTRHGVGFCVVDDAGTKFWDDELTNDEQDIICGVHRCYTGK